MILKISCQMRRLVVYYISNYWLVWRNGSATDL